MKRTLLLFCGILIAGSCTALDPDPWACVETRKEYDLNGDLVSEKSICVPEIEKLDCAPEERKLGTETRLKTWYYRRNCDKLGYTNNCGRFYSQTSECPAGVYTFN